MYETMHDARGVGLAAPQVGVQQRFFVYDVNDEHRARTSSSTPRSSTRSGEWTYEEGCLSLPGLAFEIVRPKIVTVHGLDLDGNEVVIEGDELLGRVFLHEIDHLDGVLMRRPSRPATNARRPCASSATRECGARPAGGRPPPLTLAGKPSVRAGLSRHPGRRGPAAARARRRRPRRRAGRHPTRSAPLTRRGATDPSPGAGRGRQLGLAVRTPAKAREVIDEVARPVPTLGVVVAFGQLLPVALLDALPSGLSTCTSRCCPAGAAPRRSNVPSSPATPRPAFVSCNSKPDSIPGRCTASERVPIGARRDRRRSCTDRLVDVGTRLLDVLPNVAEPHAGRPGAASRPTPTNCPSTSSASTRIGPRSSWTGSCGPAIRGPARGCTSAAGG